MSAMRCRFFLTFVGQLCAVGQQLSVILFGVGIALIIFAALFSVIRNQETWGLIFGGLGTANVIILLLYRPIERIQSGVDALIKSQIACLSFQAQYDAVARVLATMPKDADHSDLLKMAQYLRDTTTQLIVDLGQQSLVSPAPSQVEKDRRNSS